MSRRRKPEPDGRLLLKVGCTGKATHKKLTFDTLSLDADLETGRISVHHNASRRGPRIEANTPHGGSWRETGEYFNYRYVCPLCKRDYPINSFTAGEKIFGPAVSDGMSFLDLSYLRSILSK